MIFNKYFTLLIIGFIWGSQFYFQKIALEAFSPVWIGVFRSAIGFLTLAILCRIVKSKSKKKRWLLYAVIGFFEALIPFILVPWGQQYVTTSVASILMGTIPFFVIIFSLFFASSKNITTAHIVSIIVGFAGLCVLFYPDLSGGNNHIEIAGALAILGASSSFACALILLGYCKDEHPLIVTRNMLGIATLEIFIVAVITPSQYKFIFTPESIVSVLYLGIFCAGFVYILYVSLINKSGSVFASLSNYLVPTFGVLIGTIISHESLGANAWVALSIILIAIFVNQYSSFKRGKGTVSLSEDLLS